MMNKLEANKVLAVILFNGLKEKMEQLEHSVNCRTYRVGCYYDDDYTVTFITPNIYVRHEGDYVGSVSNTKCTLENDDLDNSELIVDALLAVSQVFVGDTGFTVSADTDNETGNKFMVLNIINTFDEVEKIDALHDLLIKGITDINF